MIVGSLSLLGPRARQCTGALMTTIHRNINACGAPMLVGPPGKLPLGPCVKTSHIHSVFIRIRRVLFYFIYTLFTHEI